MHRRTVRALMCSLLVSVSSLRAAPGSPLPRMHPDPAPAPGPVPEGSVGTLSVLVDLGACVDPLPSCRGLSPLLPAGGNAVPLRLVVQREVLASLPPLALADFAVDTQFSPAGSPPLAAVDCEGCFETRPGDTYGLWVAPEGVGAWTAGTYFVRVGLHDGDRVAPAVTRIEIGGEPPKTCDRNAAPTAEFSSTEVTTLGLPQSIVHVSMDGSLSSDPETQISRYVFSCGNGTQPIPIPGQGPDRANCNYVVDTIPHTYTAELVVQDRGTGEIDPNTGTWECQKSSAPDTMRVNIVPFQP